MTIKNYDEFKHEASFAHWDWDVAKARIIIDYYFDNNTYISDTFMTTKDAMEEITKYDTITIKLLYLELHSLSATLSAAVTIMAPVFCHRLLCYPPLKISGYLVV